MSELRVLFKQHVLSVYYKLSYLKLIPVCEEGWPITEACPGEIKEK